MAGAGVRTKDDIYRNMIPKLAAVDAKHDFDSDRAKAIKFHDIWSRYKGIGLPVERSDIISNEYEALNEIFPFINAGPGNDIDKFRAKFLHDGQIGGFQRFAEDPIPYVIKSKHVATRQGDESYTWTCTSKELYNFMNPHGRPEIAVLIDTANVPFCEKLAEGVGAVGAAKEGTVNIINSREGINDAAGKKTVKAKKPSQIIELVEVNDDPSIKPELYNTDIVYPAMDLTRIPIMTDYELFCSKYSLTLSPINIVNGIESISLSFTDKYVIRQENILLGVKQNAHPNTVTNLSQKMSELSHYLFGAGNIGEKVKYHTLIQAKRSGDWLQVLACTNPVRFGLPSKTRICFITIDKVALAYALTIGIDVIFTYAKDNERWFVFFYKNVDQVEESPDEHRARLRRQIQSTLVKLDNYEELCTTYMRKYSEILGGLIKIVEDIDLKEIVSDRRFKGDNIEKTVKEVLTIYMNLAVFISLIPTLKMKDEFRIFDDAQFPSLPLKTIEAYINLYTLNYNKLYKALQGKRVGQTDAEAIIAHLTKVISKTAASVSQKDRYSLIDTLTIFGKLFTRENGGKNGVGIFSFLSTHLDSGELRRLIGILTSIRSRIPSDKKDNIKSYDTFLKTAAILSKDTTRISPETNPEIESGDLLETIEAVSSYEVPAGAASAAAAPAPAAPAPAAPPAAAPPAAAPPAAAPAAAAPAAAGPDEVDANEDDAAEIKESTNMSDYHAALVILAFKFKDTSYKRLRDQMNRESNNLFVGGGPAKYDHHPLTTLYLLSREVGYRLTYDEDAKETLLGLTHIITSVIDSNHDIDTLSIIEHYTLVDLPKMNIHTEDILTDLKRSYYGIVNEIIVPPAGYNHTLVERIKLTSSPTITSVEDAINLNLSNMKRIIQFVRDYESTVAMKPTLATGLTAAEMARERANAMYTNKRLEGHGGSRKRTRNRKYRLRRRKGSPRRKTRNNSRSRK